MLKLIKYEFRKNQVSLLAMLLIAIALFALAPIGKACDNTAMMVISVTGLIFYTIAAFIYVLIRGVSAYSGELKSKTGYLLMMTPHSAITIVVAKLLFALVFAALFAAVSAVATYFSAKILLKAIPDAETFIDFSDMILSSGGVNTFALLSTVCVAAMNVLSFVVVMVAAAYLAITLSATVMHQRRGRGIISFLLFVAVAALTIWLDDLLFSVNTENLKTAGDLILAMLPQTLFCLAVGGVYAVLSGVILKKWVIL